MIQSFGKMQLCWLLALLCLACGCKVQGKESNQSPEDQAPSRADLVQKYREMGKMFLVYPSQSPDAEAYRTALEHWKGSSRRMQYELLADTALTEAQAANSSLFLIGKPDENIWLKQWAASLPFSYSQDSLHFLGQSLDPAAILQIGFYPNPLNPQFPICISTSMRDEGLLSLFEAGFRGYSGTWAGSWGYQVEKDKKSSLLGFFAETGPQAWQIPGELHWDLAPLEKVAEFEDWLEFHHQLEADRLAELDEVLGIVKAQRQAIEADLGSIAGMPKIQVQAYPDLELKGLSTMNTRPAHEDGGLIYLGLHPAWRGFGIPEINRKLLAAALGEAQANSSLAIALSQYYTPKWQRLGWESIAARFVQIGDRPQLALLMANENPNMLTLHDGAFMAAAAAFLKQKFGLQKVLEMNAKGNLSNSFYQGLEQEWQAFVLTLKNSPSIPPSQANLPFLKGFNLAHEGYQIYNGYCSKAACKSVAYTQSELNSNTVSIIPYTGISDVNKPESFRIFGGAGGESDESVVNCAWAAKSKGMYAMLKPQIWSWNNWTGAIEMKSEADWQAFFAHYYDWMSQYAMLAEIHEIPMLCIGVELSKVALKRPDDWRNLIRKLRGLYHGKLVYAANWGEEFEQMTWWDELDYIGLNCYYPLSKNANASQKELDKGFRSIVEKMEKVQGKFNKPLLITEIGFGSHEATWMQPHADPDQQKRSDEAQAMCYEAMFKALEGKPWLAGIYLWKWPSFMPDYGKDARTFSPYRKPAESLIKDWFGKH